MKNFKTILVLAISVAFFSCSKDDEPTQTSTPTALTVQTFSNLYAPVIGGGGQPVSGDFVKFSFATGQVIATGDNWDIAFRSTTILVNGGVATTGQPERTGIGAASIVSSIFSNVTTAPVDNLFNQDTATLNAIPTGSGNGWYNYNSSNNVISPIAGKVIVVKTHDGKYAKMEILNYYQNAPANPTGTEPSRYYKFNFVYQPNGSKNF
ncbi:HmuY family protein [Flavobacterium sp.]|uniref:HmuY family protein n=1 Tax=Flavobacterium sp. TaxID=239 RepID=UPI0037527E62